MSRASDGLQPVALDGHGADGGPEVVYEGADIAAAAGIPIRVFGPPSPKMPPGVEIVPCDEWIPNAADPVAAVRGAPGASVVQAADDVAGGSACALVSAGSTGATLAAATFSLRRLRGVSRPGLAAQVPMPGEGNRRFLMLDVGASSEARSKHLVQFAYLGSAFSKAALGVAEPRVALLTIGEEEGKGNNAVVEAFDSLSKTEAINFVGNAEGRDLFRDRADVIVCDGFTGNVALKVMEGTARAVADGVRDAARANPIASLGGMLLRPSMAGLKRTLDPDATGGAILLGLRAVAVVAHGSSSPEGIANAIKLAWHAAEEGATEQTAALLATEVRGRAPRIEPPPPPPEPLAGEDEESGGPEGDRPAGDVGSGGPAPEDASAASSAGDDSEADRPGIRDRVESETEATSTPAPGETR
ncbi:MAG: phosphate acyltransferase PlsX [bacterium]